MTEIGPAGVGTTHARSGRAPMPGLDRRIPPGRGDPHRRPDRPSREAPHGDPGELICAARSSCSATDSNPAATAEDNRAGRLAAHRRPRHDGRHRPRLSSRPPKDMIITSGYNVYPAEIERVLAAHPGIGDVAVVGRPHPDYGESIVAVIAPREGTTVTLDDVRAFCADKIARYKIPHDLVVGTIPRNPSGKVLKHQLRDRVRAAHAAAP